MMRGYQVVELKDQSGEKVALSALATQMPAACSANRCAIGYGAAGEI